MKYCYSNFQVLFSEKCNFWSSKWILFSIPKTECIFKNENCSWFFWNLLFYDFVNSIKIWDSLYNIVPNIIIILKAITFGKFKNVFHANHPWFCWGALQKSQNNMSLNILRVFLGFAELVSVTLYKMQTDFTTKFSVALNSFCWAVYNFSHPTL